MVLSFLHGDFYEIREFFRFLFYGLLQTIQIAQKTTTTNTPKTNERNTMDNLATGNRFLGRAYWTSKYLYTPWGDIYCQLRHTERQTKKLDKKRIRPKLSPLTKPGAAKERTHLKTVCITPTPGSVLPTA